MPRTLTFPSPSTNVCPVCDVRLTDLPCASCGADLARPESAELHQIDGELHRLAVLRGVLVERLLAPRPSPVDAAAPVDAPSRPAPPPPPPARSSAAGGGRGASNWSVAEILVGLGGLSLIAAVVVFVAVAWSDLAAWAQGGLLFAATGAVLAGAVACRRRELTATGESLGMVTVALGLADVQVVRTALDGAISARSVWSTGLVAVAALALSTGRAVRLRGMAAAGAALALVPVPLAAAGLDIDSAVWWAFGAQSLVAATVAARLTSRSSLERSILAAGAATSWIAAATFGLADALLALSGDLDAVPGSPVALLASLAASSIAVGAVHRIRPLVAAGLLASFVPATVVVAAVGTLSVLAATLVTQCALGVAVAATLRSAALPDADRRVLATVLDVGAVFSAAGAMAAAVVLGLIDPWLATPTMSVSAVATLLALASVGVAGAVGARWQRTTAATVLVASVGAVLAAAALSRVSSSGSEATTVVMLTGAVLALGTAALAQIDPRRPWTAPLVAASAAVSALASVPFAAVGVAVLGLFEVAISAVDADAGSSLLDHVTAASSIDPGDLPSVATLSQLLAIVLVGLAAMFHRRAWGRWMVSVATIAALVALPIVSGASVLLSAIVYGVAAGAAVRRLASTPDDAPTVVGGALVASLLLATAAATPALMIAATVLVTGGLAVLALRGLESGSDTASLWVVATLVSGLGGITLDALRVGSGGSVPSLVALGAATVGSLAAPAIGRRWGDERRDAVLGADVVVAATLVVSTLATRSLDAASAAVAVIALVAGAHSLRPSRRPLLGVAVAATVVLTWMRLAAADVILVEAYTLPLAGALLLCGALVRPGAHSSWVRSGSGLFAALAPTALLAIVDGDVPRTVAVVLGGASAAIWGACQREQAPLATGGAALTAVAVRHLGPVANELPRYVVFAVAGVALLAAGATFEQRRRDLRRARDAFGRLA